MSLFLHLYPGDKFMLLAVNAILQATVVILAAWLLSRLAFHRHAAVRHGLWLAALVLVLISPVTAFIMDAANVRIVSLSLPAFLTADETPADVVQLPSDHQGAFTSATLTSEALTPIPSLGADRKLVGPRENEVRSSQEYASTDASPSAGVSPSSIASSTTEAEPRVVTPPAPTVHRISILARLRAVAGAVFGIWILGVVYGLLRFGHGALALRRLLRMAQPGDKDERLRPILAQIERHLGLKNLPPVLLWRDAKLRITPLTVGIFRPVIVLSKNLLKSMTPAELRDVLVHECAHVLRRDSAVGLLQRIAITLFWPYPLVALLNRQLTLAREEVCDNYVLLHATGPQYAQTLFDLSERIQPLSPNLVQVGLFQHYCPLERRVAGLLDMRRNIMTKINRWAALGLAIVFLSIALLAAGSRILQAQPEETKNNDNAPTKEEKKEPIEEKSKLETIVTGQVADPKGKALADVQVTVVGRKREPEASSSWGFRAEQIILGQAKTDVQGRFRISMPRVSSATYYEVHAVVLAEGYGLGFQPVGLDVDRPELKIQLPEERVLQCRLVDAKGNPAAEAIVRVISIGKGESNKDYAGLYYPDLKEPQPFWPQPLKTDQDGRFTLRGVAHDQQVGLQIRDDRFARDDLIVKPAEELGKELTLTPPPAQILEGDIVYEDTRKPVAHARLSIGASKTPPPSTCIMNMPAQTDENGHFKVNPYSGAMFFITAYPPDGEPYLVFEKEIELKDGKLPPKIEVALPRGVLVRGKVVETPSGKPVAGAGIQYEECNNPNAKEGILMGWNATVVSNAEGGFQIAVPPGRGALFVHGAGSDYVLRQISIGEIENGKTCGARHYGSAIVSLDLKPESQPDDLKVTIQRGVTVKGKLVGPGDKPIEEALMVSRIFMNANENYCRCSPIIIKDGQFELHGLDPEQSVPVYFLDPKNELGATVEISGKSAENGPLVVHLEPCGKAAGRFFGKEGTPLVKYSPSLSFVVTPGVCPYGMVKSRKEISADQTLIANIDRKHYWDGPLTDDDGRCTFPALIPGATYRFDIFHESNDWDVKDFTVKSGETLQLPDLKLDIKADEVKPPLEETKKEVIRLRVVDPQSAVLSINKMFGISIDSKTTPAGVPKIDVNIAMRLLLIHGTEEQIAQIRQLLEKMGESDIGRPDAAIQRREVNKLVKDFPEKTDLSTPESALAAWNRAYGRLDAKAVYELGWMKYGPKDIAEEERFMKHDAGKDPERYQRLHLDTEVVEVLTYRDDFAEVITKFPAGAYGDPYSKRSFGKINGEWKNWGEERFASVEAARANVEEFKEKRYNIFFLDKKEILAGKKPAIEPSNEEKPSADKDEAAKASDIQRREVNKLVKDFPEKTDLSTPESALAAYHRAMAKKDTKAVLELGWRKYGPAEIEDMERFWKNDTPKDMEIYLQAVLDAEVREALVYRDEVAGVISKLKFPEGVGRHPFSLRFFGKIDGQWKNLGEDRLPSIEAARLECEEKKELGYKQFLELKKALLAGKQTPETPSNEVKVPPDKYAAVKAITPDSERLILMGLVENFFNHNAVDITSRKTLEWGEIIKNADGARSIRYKFEARIWDKETMIFDRIFTFDKDNVMTGFQDPKGPPVKKEPKKIDVNSKEGMQKLVEEFFSNNFRDITARETIEWGEVEKDKDGNSSIRYKYEATIWSKDIQTMNQIFTFDKKGEFVDVKNVEGYPKKASDSP